MDAAIWASVPQGPPDAILGVTEAFKADTFDKKINLGVGAYRDENGKARPLCLSVPLIAQPWVLPSVREAERRIVEAGKDKEYAPIAGDAVFTGLAAKLMYGTESKPLNEGRVAITQSLSGTGALRIGGAFIEKFYPHAKRIYVPQPTWGNHVGVFQSSGLEVKRYRYYDPKTIGLDFDGWMDDLKTAPEHSIFVVHACAHNPTGIDPTKDQWRQIVQAFKSKQHLAFVDSAYQGFASGDVDADAFAPRLFVSEGIPMMLAQSFAKNMGLYGERVGAFSIVCESPETKKKVESQLKIIVRALYSSPPVHGARIAATVLGDPSLYKQWLGEVKHMADRIISMRDSLKSILVKDLGSKHGWDHITNQIGMFAFTGISPEQVKELTQSHHIYLTQDGRISVAGITPSNVRRLAEALHAVTANKPKL